MTAALAPIPVERELSDYIEAKCDTLGCPFWSHANRAERDYDLPYMAVSAHIADTGHVVTVTAEFRSVTQYGPAVTQ